MDFTLSTSTWMPVQIKRAWMTEDIEPEAALVARSLHQNALVLHFVINILVKKGLVPKLPETMQACVLCPRGCKQNRFGLSTRPRLIRTEGVDREVERHFGPFKGGTIKCEWKGAVDHQPSLRVPGTEKPDGRTDVLWTNEGLGEWQEQRLQVGGKKTKT